MQTMDDFADAALITRWTEAFVWATGDLPYESLHHEGGWFVWCNSDVVKSRARRHELIEMIIDLENRPKAA